MIGGKSMKKIITILIVLLLSGFFSDSKEGYFSENISMNEEEVNEGNSEKEPAEDETFYATNILFNFEDLEKDERIIKVVNEAYFKIVDSFDLDYQDKIVFTIFKDQASFWSNTFEGDNNGVTTGYGSAEKSIVHITSPKDVSIKSEEEMLKVPVHEMVHVLLPHEYLDIREGIAYYLAGQLREYTTDDIPENLSTLITYEGDVETIKNSYNFAGYKTKFIIEECLHNDCVKYKVFMNRPDDYTILGYDNESEFIEVLKRYLEENASI